MFTPAKNPTFYFIGVTTNQSSIMHVFPTWARELHLENTSIRGIDLPLHAPAAQYRAVVEFIKQDPLSVGALVTTHKIDLFNACRDLFDYIDPYAQCLEEISCISKRGDVFCAHAKDPISCTLAMQTFIPDGFWRAHCGEALLIGAGGSALAIVLSLCQNNKGDDRPSRITIANRSTPRLQTAAVKLGKLDLHVPICYAHGAASEENDRFVAGLPQYSLIVNATGLGKDAPGSPTTNAVEFPANSLLWEINYRGDLIFKEQGEAQRESKHLHVENGWNYFIHGWTQVIEEVFHLDLSDDDVQKLGNLAQQI